MQSQRAMRSAASSNRLHAMKHGASKCASDVSSQDKTLFHDSDSGGADMEAEKILEPGELSFDEDTRGGLGRHLGLTSTTFPIIGRIIGTGIFSTPSSITASVGSLGAVLMLWVLGGLLPFAELCVWLELGCMFPRSGGEQVYLEAVYKRPKILATVLFSTQAVLLGFTASGCIGFASNILVAADHIVTPWNERGIAVGVIVAVTIMIHSRQMLDVPDPQISFRKTFAGSVMSGGPYATALFKVLNSYSGWNNAAYVLNEVKRPVHTLNIAGPLGLGICTLLYMFANVAYFSAATPQEISKSGITLASFFVGRVFGLTARRVISVFIALSALGNVITVTFAQSRVNQELAKEGVLPFGKFWASNWPKGAPGAGLLLHFIPSCIVIVAIPVGDAFNFILDTWIIVPFFFLIAQGFLLTAPFLRPPGGKGDTSLPYWLYPIVGITVLVVGGTWWLVWRVVWPELGKFEWVETKASLRDGTVVTEFEKRKVA
ncbi:high affinity methionine permease [Hyaloscypha finlandica]|nr:high affinity methionine permease [Hyaloscypha finlandica]